MKEKKVTIYDIAANLNISPGTVSRVLNNSTLYSKEKRDIIFETAKKMEYKKRAIKKQSKRVILNIKLFLPVSRYSYIHLFYDVAELIVGIQDGFKEVKVNIITKINDGDISGFQNKKLGDIDGCIFAFGTPGKKMTAILKEREIPYILLNRIDSKENYIAYDSNAGMQTLIGELSKKHKKPKLCYVGFSEIKVSIERKKGVEEACKAWGIGFSKKDIYSLSTINEIATSVMSGIIKRKYNSVLCFNDVFAVYLYQEALQRGIKIPETFSLTGFDNSPVLDLLSNRIDTIELSVHKLGYEAGKYLERRIVQRNPESIQQKIIGNYIKGTTI